jgi:Arc/MetJ-type ribon-helix-helix transcriptional regulator
MPKNRNSISRKTIRIPSSLMDVVDQMVGDKGLYVNRQQFVESAIREKIEKLRIVEQGGSFELGALLAGMNREFLDRVKEKYVLHSIMAIVNQKTMPDHHLDLDLLKQKVKEYTEETAKTEGRILTEKQIGELTNNLLKYHMEILKELKLK